MDLNDVKSINKSGVSRKVSLSLMIEFENECNFRRFQFMSQCNKFSMMISLIKCLLLSLLLKSAEAAQNQTSQMNQPSQLFLANQESPISLVFGPKGARWSADDEEGGGFIMQAAAYNQPSSAGQNAASLSNQSDQTQTLTTEIDSATLTTSSTPVESSSSSEPTGGSQQDQSAPDGIMIDANRRQFVTHDQLNLLNASTKDEQIQLMLANNPSFSGLMPKVNQVSSFFSDLLSYAANLNNPIESSQDNQPATTLKPDLLIQNPANSNSNKSLTSCPGICRSVLTASILCRNEIDAPCPSFLQRCCDKDDNSLDSTPVETSAPIDTSDADFNPISTVSYVYQGQESSSRDSNASTKSTESISTFHSSSQPSQLQHFATENQTLSTTTPAQPQNSANDTHLLEPDESSQSISQRRAGPLYFLSSAESVEPALGDELETSSAAHNPSERATSPIESLAQPALTSDLQPAASASSNAQPASASGVSTNSASTDSNLEDKCLGYCTLPMFTVLCDSTYASADCGSSLKCCVIDRSSEQSSIGEQSSSSQQQASSDEASQQDPQAPAKCKGSCLRLYHSSLCTKPNEIQLDSSGCLPNFVCCAQPNMKLSGTSSMQAAPPSSLAKDSSFLATLLPPPPPPLPAPPMTETLSAFGSQQQTSVARVPASAPKQAGTSSSALGIVSQLYQLLKMNGLVGKQFSRRIPTLSTPPPVPFVASASVAQQVQLPASLTQTPMAIYGSGGTVNSNNNNLQHYQHQAPFYGPIGVSHLAESQLVDMKALLPTRPISQRIPAQPQQQYTLTNSNKFTSPLGTIHQQHYSQQPQLQLQQYQVTNQHPQQQVHHNYNQMQQQYHHHPQHPQHNQQQQYQRQQQIQNNILLQQSVPNSVGHFNDIASEKYQNSLSPNFHQIQPSVSTIRTTQQQRVQPNQANSLFSAIQLDPTRRPTPTSGQIQRATNVSDNAQSSQPEQSSRSQSQSQPKTQSHSESYPKFAGQQLTFAASDASVVHQASTDWRPSWQSQPDLNDPKNYKDSNDSLDSKESKVSKEPNEPSLKSSQCGTPGLHRNTSGLARGRIMGGSDSKPGHWCWQAALMNNKNEYLCGGALIGSKWVLTAAHCVTQHLRSESSLLVRLGQWNLSSSIESGRAKSIPVRTSYVHHNHNGITLDNDIALLRLEESADLEDVAICLVCLPERLKQKTDSISRRCVVTGYGYETEAGPAALRVRETQLPLVNELECQNKTSEALGKPFSLPANSFCAGGELGQDACHGDGGSPLACLVNGYYELSGIVSWGYKCGHKDLPGLYSKVSAFVGWINQIISVNN